MTVGPSLEDLGLRVATAGPDVTTGDVDGLEGHGNPGQEALRADLAALRSRGWGASRATLDELRSLAQTSWGESITGVSLNLLFGMPIYLDESVPAGYLRPVYIERISEES